MWTVQIIDKKYNTLIRYNVLNMNINSCLAAVKNQFELQAKNIILPDKAVKMTSDLNISNGEILCPNCDTLFSA
jgi:hypothetical protein